LPNQGGKRSAAATKGSGICSIELMAAALRRTAAHVILRHRLRVSSGPMQPDNVQPLRKMP